MGEQTAKTILTNALREIPGTRDWIRVGDVAQRLLDRLHENGAQVVFPDGEPAVAEVSHQDAAFRRLVAMDKADR